MCARAYVRSPCMDWNGAGIFVTGWIAVSARVWPAHPASVHDDTTAKGCRRDQRSTRYGTGRLSVDDSLSPFISTKLLVRASEYHNTWTTLFAARYALISPGVLKLSTYIESTASRSADSSSLGPF